MRPQKESLDLLIDDVAHRKRQLEELRLGVRKGDENFARTIAIYEREIADLEAQISASQAVSS